MYELKTLLPEFEIELPRNMYAMGTQGLAATAFINGSCNSSTEVGAVLVRQDKVLQQLKELKAQLADIRSTLGVGKKDLQNITKSTARTQNSRSIGGLRKEPHLHDIVINGHPNFIPYALLALKHAWQDLFVINIKTFTHSTMADIGPAAREFERKLQQAANCTSAGDKPKINVTLIWKNCEHTEIISSPTMYVPIYGEVNIIRYFGRVGPSAYQYENSPLCNEIDLVLDICYRLLRCNTPKSIVAMVRTLNERLGKQQFFGGEAMSVADIGVHSSLKRMPTIKDKDLTPVLIAWRKRVEIVTRI